MLADTRLYIQSLLSPQRVFPQLAWLEDNHFQTTSQLYFLLVKCQFFSLLQRWPSRHSTAPPLIFVEEPQYCK